MTEEPGSARTQVQPAKLAPGGAELPLRIIVIDDNPDDRAEVRRLLLKGSGRRYRFLEAETGPAGIALVRAQTAGDSTCVLLDHYLPGMTSLEVLAELRDAEGLLPCPVVVITGADATDVGSAVLRAGAHAYVGKDWLNPAALTRVIANAAESWAMVLELRKREVALARSEREFRALADNTPDILARFDRDLRHVFVNRAIEGVTGTAPVDFIGKTHRDLGFPAHLLEPWESALQKVFATGLATDIEMAFDGLQGHREYATRLVPEFAMETKPGLVEPEVEFVLGVTRDITEIKRAQLAERIVATRLRMALAAARAGTWDWNLHTREVVWSPEMFELYGRDRQLGAPRYGESHTTVLPEDSSVVAEALAALFKARATDYRCKYRVCHPAHGVRWLDCVGEAQYNDAGDAVSLTGITTDITELKTLEESMRQQDARKDLFLVTLGHELRGPLAALSNGLHILKGNTRADASDRARAIMERQLRQMVGLLDDLLDVARINRGAVELRRHLVTAQSIIEWAIEGSQVQINERQHTLHLQIPADSIWLDADAARLTQAISNLLINAAKYTPVGGRIALELSVDDGFALVEVADNGSGIRPEEILRIFDVFTQLPNSRKHASGGLGIGLSLVKSFVEMHGGSIQAQSAGPGLGSRFVVRLPKVEPSSDRVSLECAFAPSARPDRAESA